MNEQKFLNKKQPQDTINVKKLKRKKSNELQHKIVIFLCISVSVQTFPFPGKTCESFVTYVWHINNDNLRKYPV